MAASNSKLHLIAAIGTAVLAGGLAGPTLYLTSRAEASTGPVLEDMTAIEASIAYKKPKAPTQPQKKTSQPDVVKPDGVSHDENKKPLDEPPKKDEPKKTDPQDLSKKFQHATDDDNETGKPVQDVGDFNGQEYGFAEETKGDPYFQGIAKDVHESWEVPSILKGAGEPVGCLHISADGKIADTKLHAKSGDENIDDSVERALKKVKKLRDDNPQPVPTYLLKAATTKWVCFKFNLS